MTFSVESLIRLTHRSSFGNSLGVWEVRAGHSRLRAFSQVVKDLRGITVSLVPVPKTSLFVPEIAGAQKYTAESSSCEDEMTSWMKFPVF